jgi:hypothetical protein
MASRSPSLKDPGGPLITTGVSPGLRYSQPLAGLRVPWVGSPVTQLSLSSGLRAFWLAPFPPLAVTLPFPNRAAGQLTVSRPGFPAEALAASGTPL